MAFLTSPAKWEQLFDYLELLSSLEGLIKLLYTKHFIASPLSSITYRALLSVPAVGFTREKPQQITSKT